MATKTSPRAPGHAAGNIAHEICAAVGFPETIRLRRQVEAVLLLRQEQETRLAALARGGRAEARVRRESFDALAEATDALLERLADAGFLA